jgi:hypothetical protein
MGIDTLLCLRIALVPILLSEQAVGSVIFLGIVVVVALAPQLWKQKM